MVRIVADKEAPLRVLTGVTNDLRERSFRAEGGGPEMSGSEKRMSPDAEQHADEQQPTDESSVMESSPEVADVEAPSVEAMGRRIEELERQNAELHDKWLRAVAEYQNLRKRMMAERAFAFREGKRQVLLELLPVVDNLERSLDAFESEPANSDIEALREGVRMIYK
ncbi:MAG TPA: nucleotide exchange factor GrpE, partial [Armatimonadetes bacterium]|nr:nucleotide exchange factor GrpE [Armatimonadota bacterium]